MLTHPERRERTGAGIPGTPPRSIPIALTPLLPRPILEAWRKCYCFQLLPISTLYVDANGPQQAWEIISKRIDSSRGRRKTSGQCVAIHDH